MKKIILHAVPVIISVLWLVTKYQTYDPITLKGPVFLKFYLLLLSGFYISVFILKFFKEQASKTTFFFMIFIFLLASLS
ncbi:hypothetical protein [Chryseobacterium defluvii]|nr:hypothetical protein [Chryseobacterium defluvii]